MVKLFISIFTDMAERDSQGRFVKGNTSGVGRSGTIGAMTNQVRELVQEAVQNNMINFQNIFNQLEPKDQMSSLIALIKYVVPAKTGHDGQTNQLINITIEAPKGEEIELNNLLDE